MAAARHWGLIRSALAMAALLARALLAPPPLGAMASLPTGPSERGNQAEIGAATAMIDMIPAHVRLLTDREYQVALEEQIAAARTEVVVSAHHFSLSREGALRPLSVGEALAAAAARGVNVVVIMEIGREASPITKENRETAAFLSERGVKVYADMSGTTVHSKIVVIDRRLVLLGSHDLNQQSLGTYREATLAVDSVILARELLHLIESFDPVPYNDAP